MSNNELPFTQSDFEDEFDYKMMCNIMNIADEIIFQQIGIINWIGDDFIISHFSRSKDIKITFEREKNFSFFGKSKYYIQVEYVFEHFYRCFTLKKCMWDKLHALMIAYAEIIAEQKINHEYEENLKQSYQDDEPPLDNTHPVNTDTSTIIQRDDDKEHIDAQRYRKLRNIAVSNDLANQGIMALSIEMYQDAFNQYDKHVDELKLKTDETEID